MEIKPDSEAKPSVKAEEKPEGSAAPLEAANGVSEVAVPAADAGTSSSQADQLAVTKVRTERHQNDGSRDGYETRCSHCKLRDCNLLAV